MILSWQFLEDVPLCSSNLRNEKFSAMEGYIQYVTDGRTARIWKYFTDETHWFPISRWPKWAIREIMKEHKKRRSRFDLFRFFWRNGMDPDRAAIYTVISDAMGGRVIRGDYDDNAVRHVDELVHLANSNTFETWNPLDPIYDIELGRPVTYPDERDPRE